MPLAVLSEAPILCDMATGPGVLTVTNNQTVVMGGVPFATIMDFAPEMNIPSMGMCMSLGNPATASETASADGVLTPGPCVPTTTAPWVCANAQAIINEMPMLDQTGILACDFGGQITITEPLNPSLMLP